MILYITPSNKPLYYPQLNEMYALRHMVFKETLNWDVKSNNGLEKDEYDHLDAHYILYLNTEKKVKGCMRLIPSTKKYMIREVFSYMVPGKIFNHSSVWEVSRFAIDPSEKNNLRIKGINQITYEMYAALVEFGLANHVQKYIFIATPAIESLLKKIGWVPQRLSRVISIGRVKSLLGSINVDPEVFIHLVFEGNISPFFSLNSAKEEEKDTIFYRKRVS